MMRIAIAGGGGLAYLFAEGLSQTDNAYSVSVLSRFTPTRFSHLDVHQQVVDYHDISNLSYALQGTDLVISTVSGPEQLNIINAAGRSRVRLFVPAEFEGCLSNRPAAGEDSFGSNSASTISLLKDWYRTSRMAYTVFSCGLFMERFLPHGLGSLDIGHRSGNTDVGTFLVDLKNCSAEYGDKDVRGHSARVCLTSVYDVARFVVAAVELGPGTWPREFSMRGDRMTVRDLVGECCRVRNVAFNSQVRQWTDLKAYVEYYGQTGDTTRMWYYSRLLETVDGRYDFSQATLNSLVQLEPVSFAQWLAQYWEPAA